MPNFQQKKYKERASNSRYQSYVFSRNGTLYFRITVPNHLQSLIKKRELRRSLNIAKLKEARPLALKLATLSIQYFELLEKIQNDVVRFDNNNLSQLTLSRWFYCAKATIKKKPYQKMIRLFC